jgi:hypothetical protein
MLSVLDALFTNPDVASWTGLLLKMGGWLVTRIDGIHAALNFFDKKITMQ